MGRTTIEVDEETRDKLRRYKAIDGLTYDEAILELLKAAPHAEPGAAGIVDADDQEADEADAVGAQGPGSGGPTEGGLNGGLTVRTRTDELAAVDFPDGRDHEACIEAVEAAARYIEREGGASMRDIVAAVGSDHPCGYDVPDELEEGERYRGAWWRKVVKPGLEAVDAIEAPAPGGSAWRPASAP